MNEMLIGAIAASCIVIGLFFLRFWRGTRDIFFLFFAISFFIEGINRTALVLSSSLHETSPGYYLIRVIAYSFIIFAILAKNKRRKTNVNVKPE